MENTFAGYITRPCFFDAAAIQQLWQPFEPICTKALEIFRSLGPDGVQLP